MCEDPVPNAVRGDVPDPQPQRGTGPREVVPPPAVKPPNPNRPAWPHLPWPRRPRRGPEGPRGQYRASPHPPNRPPSPPAPRVPGCMLQEGERAA